MTCSDHLLLWCLNRLLLLLLLLLLTGMRVDVLLAAWLLLCFCFLLVRSQMCIDEGGREFVFGNGRSQQL